MRSSRAGRLLTWMAWGILGLRLLGGPSAEGLDLSDFAEKGLDSQAVSSQIQAPDLSTRLAALISLSKALDAGNVTEDGWKLLGPQVVAMLQDPEESLRAKAAEVLGKLGKARAPAEAPGALTQSLSDPAASVRAACLFALVQLELEPRGQLATCLKSVEDPDPSVRVAALVCLRGVLPQSYYLGTTPGEVEDWPAEYAWREPGRQAVLARAKDAAPEVRAAALEAMLYLPRTEPVFKGLLGAAKDPSEEARRLAIQGLDNWWPDREAALDAVVQALSDPSPDVSQTAAYKLSSMAGPGDRALLPALEQAWQQLQDKGPEGEPAIRTLDVAIGKVRLEWGIWLWLWLALLPFFLAALALKRGKMPEPRRRMRMAALVLLFGAPLAMAADSVVWSIVSFYKDAPLAYGLADAWAAGQRAWIQAAVLALAVGWMARALSLWLFLPALPALVYAMLAASSVVTDTRIASFGHLALVIVGAGLIVGFPAWAARSLFAQARRAYEANGDLAGAKRARVFGILATVLAVVGTLGLMAFTLLIIAGMAGAHGRPFRVRGRVRVAPEKDRADWMSPLKPEADELEAAERRALATAWLEDARSEHASVAAFSRLALELLAAGAPPDLLARVHQAALEEVRHAQLCFGLAGAYAGRELGPGPFPEAVEPARSSRPATRLEWLVVLARDSMRDGCLGEGLAAAMAAEARDRARDEAVRQVLEVLARDEARHAELGWSIVDWCLEQGGEAVRRAVEAELDQSPETLGAAASGDGLRDSGRLPAARVQELQRLLRAAALARQQGGAVERCSS